MSGITSKMFNSTPSAKGNEGVEPIISGTNHDGTDKIIGYRVHIGNGYYLEGSWGTEAEAMTILENIILYMKEKFLPPPPKPKG